MPDTWNKNSYRQEQEAFVSNHDGTSGREVIFAILPNICSIILTTTALGVLRRILNRNSKVLIEFILIIIPATLCCTILSEHILTVCSAMMLISIINVLIVGNNFGGLLSYRTKLNHTRRPFITYFRALTNIITAICILAIDFRIFPRKFAKTEVFGFSLMDSGVGLFILANALVAPEAKDFGPKPKVGFFHTISRSIKQSARSCIPLLTLGFGRSVIIEVLGYQTHVTEYGIHWNFFITLAFVKLFTSFLMGTINSRYTLLSGAWILTMHEYILNTSGLKEWVLSNNPRNDFMSANREGLVSVPGYVGLYLASIAVGRMIHSTYQNAHGQSLMQYKLNVFCVKIFGCEFKRSDNTSLLLCIKLSIISMQTLAATVFCDLYFKVSRRLANAGYCMWILTFGLMILTLLLLVELTFDVLIGPTTNSDSTEKETGTDETDLKSAQECVSDESKEVTINNTIEIFEAVNYNGLAFFLLSNIMTGGINMLVQTLYIDKLTAVLILNAYMAVNVTFILILYRKQVQFKL